LPADLTTFGIPAGSWTLVAVGRLSSQKGHDDLLEAVAPLMHERPQLHLLVVGEGPEREQLTQLASRLGISSQVHLPGWQADIPGILRSSQAFALPSRWEGMPNALLEALASGLPCIATDVEGVGELIGAGEAENLVTPGDVTALRMAVKKTCETTQNTTGESPQSLFTKEHTWKNVTKKYAELFARCLK
jgi:glycosyltransferase involved in cell wall biosynthesis